MQTYIKNFKFENQVLGKEVKKYALRSRMPLFAYKCFMKCLWGLGTKNIQNIYRAFGALIFVCLQGNLKTDRQTELCCTTSQL